MGAFFLVRYNLKEAKQEQKQTGTAPGGANGPGNGSGAQAHPDHSANPSPIYTTNPHLEEIGPFQMKPPTHLLGRCHNVCILLTFAGFALALLGILTFAWGENAVSVGVVTSVATAVCFSAAVWVFI
jgi:hypothetical protein